MAISYKVEVIAGVPVHKWVVSGGITTEQYYEAFYDLKANKDKVKACIVELHEFSIDGNPLFWYSTFKEKLLEHTFIYGNTNDSWLQNGIRYIFKVFGISMRLLKEDEKIEDVLRETFKNQEPSHP